MNNGEVLAFVLYFILMLGIGIFFFFKERGAQVSEKHAGFVVNRGGAAFDDVLRLMDDVRSAVLRTSGVELEPEVKIIRG